MTTLATLCTASRCASGEAVELQSGTWVSSASTGRTARDVLHFHVLRRHDILKLLVKLDGSGVAYSCSLQKCCLYCRSERAHRRHVVSRAVHHYIRDEVYERVVIPLINDVLWNLYLCAARIIVLGQDVGHDAVHPIKTHCEPAV